MAESAIGEDGRTEEEKQAAEWAAFQVRAAAAGVPIENSPTHEDKWTNAGVSLLTGDDPHPLAALLRGETDIPLSARILLADLLEGDKVLHLKLKLECTETKRNNFEKDFEKLAVAGEYEERITKGEGSQDIAAEFNEKKVGSERTVFNYVKFRKGFFGWLRGEK